MKNALREEAFTYSFLLSKLLEQRWIVAGSVRYVVDEHGLCNYAVQTNILPAMT